MHIWAACACLFFILSLMDPLLATVSLGSHQRVVHGAQTQTGTGTKDTHSRTNGLHNNTANSTERIRWARLKQKQVRSTRETPVEPLSQGSSWIQLRTDFLLGSVPFGWKLCDVSRVELQYLEQFCNISES